MDKDLYDLPPRELKKIPTVCGSLREALASLDKDRAFLKTGGVFNDDFIDSFIELKMTEVARFEMTPHPVEFRCTIPAERHHFPAASAAYLDRGPRAPVFCGATGSEGLLGRRGPRHRRGKADPVYTFNDARADRIDRSEQRSWFDPAARVEVDGRAQEKGPVVADRAFLSTGRTVRS